MKAWSEEVAQFIQMKGMSCQQQEVHHRAAVQNKLAGIDEGMCSEVLIFRASVWDSLLLLQLVTPGVMTRAGNLVEPS